MAEENQYFTWNGSRTSGVLSDGLMVAGGGEVKIQGHTGVSEVFDDGQIVSMSLVEQDGGIYKYQVNVTGKCDVFKSHIELHFTDKTGDTYDLRISSPVKENHYVDYNSDDARITKISWTQ